ncbi:putative serine esterase-domain-containing protein [Schizophyllum amplum]|uniref:Putative serine esterase-domain-containing protein n=1 Tax=Schizophyllum amplum TaxID=97359 RepID=A0A550CL73_9AGAR|nr:putative serine esterase-domain-containing protein [Auriculariopsis ampla]
MSPVHLLVLVHGMWGNPDGTRLSVLLANTNSEEHTYDGIDWGGERVAQEIKDQVKTLEEKGDTVTRFSITGYSLGGLISRYVIGILQQQGFFENITPMNFNTVATPHLGLLRYDTFFSRLSHSIGPTLLSRTGSTKGRPLLEVMADPERVFYQALKAFRHIRIYANAINDMTVPYITACIELEDPFMEEYDEKYSPLLKSWDLPDEPPFVYVALPLLIPIFISLALLRLGLSSRKSRRRIKLLESGPSRGETLMQIVARLEKDVEDTVADMMEDSGSLQESPDASDDEDTRATERASATDKGNVHPKAKKRKQTTPKSVAQIAPLQRKMAVALNALPIHKERAFVENVRNAHAVIISRDVRNFEWHKRGEGVIRHWADSFDL